MRLPTWRTTCRSSRVFEFPAATPSRSCNSPRSRSRGRSSRRSAVTVFHRPPASRLPSLALAASAHLIYVNQWNLRKVFTEAPFDTSFHWMGGPRQISTLADASPYTPGSPMLRALMDDRSFYTCYESLQLARGSVPDRPQVFDANPGGRVGDLDFSPNELTFSVNEGAGDARVILNQNWAPGWTSTRGRDRSAALERSWRRSSCRRERERPPRFHVSPAAACHGAGDLRSRARRHADDVAAASQPLLS